MALTIALVSSSSPVRRPALDQGKAVLAGRFGPIEWLESPGIDRACGYLAGEDEERIADLEWAFASSASLVWCTRGGYGATRLLDRLDWKRFAATGKRLLGFSDTTALLVAYHRAGGRALHAPAPAADLPAQRSARSLDSLAALVFGNGREEYDFAGEILGEPVGRLEGRILAGNIALLASLAGTRHFPSGRGRLVFLEEVHEEPYRVDRMLTQLAAAGLFRGARGVVIGSMKDCVPEEPARSFTLEETLRRFARDVRLPVVGGFPFGHGGDNSVLPLGGRAVLTRTAQGFHAAIRA